MGSPPIRGSGRIQFRVDAQVERGRDADQVVERESRDAPAKQVIGAQLYEVATFPSFVLCPYLL